MILADGDDAAADEVPRKCGQVDTIDNDAARAGV